MDQLSLFDQEQEGIPETVLSPLECNKKPHSKEFISNQRLFSEHVRRIQLQHQCSWFEARKKFFELRGASPDEV